MIDENNGDIDINNIYRDKNIDGNNSGDNNSSNGNPDDENKVKSSNSFCPKQAK